MEKDSNNAIETSCATSTSFVVPPRKKSREIEHQGGHFSGNNNNFIMKPAPSTEDALVDGCKNNKGSSKQTSHTNKHKTSLIEFYERSNLEFAEFIKNIICLKSVEFF